MSVLGRALKAFLSAPETPAQKRERKEREAAAKAAAETGQMSKRQRAALDDAVDGQRAGQDRGRRRLSASPPQIEASATGRPAVVVRLPSGRVARHGWQALRPSGLLSLYKPSDEALIAAGLNDDRLNLLGDDAGNVLRYIAPRYAHEGKLHYELGGRYYTTLAVKSWPRRDVDPSMWLFFIRAMSTRLPSASVALHNWRIGASPAERSMKREIEKREVELRQLEESEGDTARVASMREQLEKLRADRNRIITNDETLFHVSCYIRLESDSLEDLQEQLSAAEEMARLMHIEVLQLPGEQRDAFVSSMPYSSDPAYMTRLRATGNAASLLPLITNTHIERNRKGKNPVVLYGINSINWTPVMMSPFNSDETIEITSVLGRMGSGKSYWLRTHIGRMAMVGVQTITIDPLGDFVTWHKQNDATIIEIAPKSPYHVNPLKRVWDARDDDWEDVTKKIERLKPLFALILGRKYDEMANGLISAGLRAFYERFAPDDERLMIDFVEVLKELNATSVGSFSDGTVQQRKELIDLLALACIDGQYKDFFQHKSNIDLDPNDPRTAKILFNLAPSGSGDPLLFATYMALTMAIEIAASSLRRKLLVFDEIHRLFAAQRSVTAMFEMFNDLIRTHRHWTTALVFATQFVDEDETNQTQKNILKAANIWVLLRATRPMLDQTIDLVKSKNTWLLEGRWLEVSASVDEAQRREPKPMVVYRGSDPIPMLSVGLSFEDAEDDKAAGSHALPSEELE